MTRRITIEITDAEWAELHSFAGWSVPGRSDVGSVLAKAANAYLTTLAPCPTCGGEQPDCTRCAGTGRGQFARVYVRDTTDGRARLEIWFGAAGTAERVADTDPELTLAHVRVDALLATLAEAPGVVITDKRAPREGAADGRA